MSKNNTLWWILLLGWAGASTWWHTCKIKSLCGDETASQVATEAVIKAPGLIIADGNAFRYEGDGNFSFAKSGHEPATGAVRTAIDSLIGYLKGNPTKHLIVKGLFSNEEVPDSTSSKLGFLRGESIKKSLIEWGLPADRITVRGGMNNDLVFRADSLLGGIDFLFADGAPTMENEIAEAQNFENIFKPLDLYFNTGSTSFIKTAGNQEFVALAKEFLESKPDRKLILTGHTDNVGSKESNLTLSRKRAEEVKRELVEKGFSAAQLTTEAWGQDAPKESNDTDAGRAANRRVSVVVK